jgi:predicted nucleic acid-binding protein
VIVVSDTSILSGLLQIGRLDLLRQVYGQVLMPDLVYQELLRLTEFGVSVEPLAATWIQVRTASETTLLRTLRSELDAGEAEALALAVELNADLVLVDERRGRKKAAELGLAYRGLLGTLSAAKALGYLAELRPILTDLQTVPGMWFRAELVAQVLNDSGE